MPRLPLVLLALALPSAPLAAGATDVAPIWEKKCASCHGKTGDGKTKMGAKHKIEDLSTAAWHDEAKHTDDFIRDVIANGVKETKMAAFKEKLSAEEIDALVKYVRGLKKG